MKAALSVLFLIVTYGEAKVGCPEIPQKGNWTCEDYAYFMQQENVEGTLQCLGYKSFTNPKRALNQSGPVLFSALRSFDKLIEINENSMNLVYEESRVYKFSDGRLNFNQLDCKEDGTREAKEQFYKGTYPFWFPLAMAFPHMEKYEFSGNKLEEYPMTTLDLDGTIHIFTKGIFTTHCNFSFSWFPFDTQNCTNQLEIHDCKLLELFWELCSQLVLLDDGIMRTKLGKLRKEDIKQRWFSLRNKPVHHASWNIKVIITEEPYNTTNSEGNVNAL